MGNGLEPYTGRELQAWLTRRGYEFHHQTGDHVFYAKGDSIVPAGGARSTEHVTAVMATKLASDAFGQNAKWLREQLGYGGARRAGGKTIPAPPTARTRAIASIDRIARTSHALNRDAYTLLISDRHASEMSTIDTMLSRLAKAIRDATHAA